MMARASAARGMDFRPVQEPVRFDHARTPPRAMIVSTMDDQARTPPSINSRSPRILTHWQPKSCARSAVTCGRVDAGDSVKSNAYSSSVSGVEEPSWFRNPLVFLGVGIPRRRHTTDEPTMPENSDRGARTCTPALKQIEEISSVGGSNPFGKPSGIKRDEFP